MRIIAVENFGKMTDASFPDQWEAAQKQGPRCIHAAFPVDFGIGFTIRGEKPGPCRAVMIGGFSAGIFISGVVALVRMMRIIDEDSVMDDLMRIGRGGIRQASDSTGNQKGPGRHPGWIGTSFDPSLPPR